ncbi:putative vacuolar protein sorting-associated protein 13A, partial [Mucuna pruriens]
MKEEKDSHVVLLSGNLPSPGAAVGEDCVPGPNIEFDQCSDVAMLADACFAMHYESPRTDVVCHKLFMYLSNTDIHCYPHIAGLLIEFFHRLSAYSNSSEKSSASNAVDISKIFSSFGLQKFGFSNYFEYGSTDSACIPLDCFPFVTIHNSGSLGNLESTLIYAIPDWRNYFILRDRKIKSSKINMKRGSKFFHVSPSKSKSDFGYFHESGIASTCDIFSTEVHLFGIRAHFHDSSCIIGTIMVPTSKSSLLFCEDSVDILSSSEGLTLTSSWGPRNFQDYLWGPSSPNLSPILNVRVRKGHNISSTADLEISIGIQHVYCMLSSEYLSIIVGYFSLSDWGGASGDQCSSEEQSDIDVKNEVKITYKFEILDSNLIFPVESNDHQFIKIELPQLYCSFIENSGVDDVLKNIPPESSVPIHKLAKRNNCINVFGRDLFLSFLLYKNDLLGLATIERNTEFLTSALIAPINADVWVRIPYGGKSNCISTSSICFMTSISSCHIVAEDSHFFDGCMAIWGVIEEFSLVDDQSKCFKSDVLQFLHSKRSLEATRTISPTLMASTIISTEVKCCIKSLFISFCHRKEDFVELIAKGDLRFICSASLINDSLVCLDLGFSTLVFFSPHDSILAKCTPTSFSTSVLSISFSQSIDGKNKLGLCLSSLDIWLHLAEWTEVVKFLNHFHVHLERTPVNAITNSLSVNASNSVKNPIVQHISSFHDSESISAPFTSQEIGNDVLMIIRSENVCITFHVPVCAGKEPRVEFQHAEGLSVTPSSVSSDIVEEKDAQYLTVSFNINYFELVIRSRDIQLKSKMEKLSSLIMIVENGRHTSWPLLDVIEVDVDAVLSKNHTNTIELNVEIICDNSNIWISHPAFHVWGAVKFDVPESGSSQYSISGVTFKFRMRKVSILLTDGRWSYNGPELEILVRNILFKAISSGKHMECSVNGDLQVNYNNIEKCLSRATEMLFDALGLMGLDDHNGNKLLHSPCAEYMCARKCGAPYVLQNLTSVPLLYRVFHGLVNPDELRDSDENHAKYVQPGSSIPIYMDENAEQKLSRFRSSHSSDSLNEQRLNGFAHHYITVQLEGTSWTSDPISMDLVGLTCFEVNFSKTYNETAEDGRLNTAPTFVVPVVFDVSVLRHSKLIRIYSTVVLLNATSTPLELRFDIPFGVSPTILGPIQPGQQFPLPLHLAEAGCVRWRPMGNSYLWSEAHNLSNLLSVNSKVGNFKSFMCYPSHPSSRPFRCCLSVKNISLTSSGWLKNNVPADDVKKHYIHHLILSAPLIINNYLPKEILLISESGGVDHTVRVSEVGTSIYHIDPSHDLGLEICIDGFKCSNFKFPRLETFCTMAKFSETKFSFSETLIFEPNDSNGPVYVTVEKVMDAYSGSRELILFVPFILYNCMGFPLCVTEAAGETNGRGFTIPSYCDVGKNETLSYKRDGLSLLTSSHELPAEVPCNPSSYMKNHTISCREDGSANSIGNYHKNLGRQLNKSDSAFRNSSSGRLKSMLSSTIQSTWKDSGSGNHEHEKVRPCIYSPCPDSSINDTFVKVSRCFPEDVKEQLPHSLWSNPFSLLPASGSSTILVPQLTSNSAFVLAMTSNSVAEEYAGRTNAITFQPRYVISNACSKEISYKQKGTDVMFYLGIGKHDHLHWTDTTRELLVSICYNESGWQWSGSFLPDHLGDTQLKMRNFVFGTSNMIRVEVQNADISMGDEKIVGNIKGNSGTNLILLSDDDTGYMPYRIDNFSKERLRIYQQRCEMFDTVIHSYASHPYTWDEPCYPRRLIVEVPGERVLGSYDLDDVKEYMPVYLPSTSEKPKRTFYLSVHAEGATKVLSVLDSNYHIFNDVKKSSVPHATVKRLYDHNLVRASEYKEKISIFVPYIGISLIDSYPQELLFACIEDVQMNLLQSLDRQCLSLLISFFQIDNQLRSTPYPVMLSFDGGYRFGQVDHMKSRDDVTRTRVENLNQMSSSSVPVLCLEISKWRKKDISFISFEYIKLRLEDFRLEIEQEVILSLFEFFTNVSSGLQYGIMPSSDHYDGVSLKNSSSFVEISENFRLSADQCPLRIAPMFNGKSKRIASLPSVVPIGAPWQEIYLLARTQKKIYIEMLELAPIKLTLSFSSAPWMLRNRILTSKEFLIHRGLMALADVEGAHIYLKDVIIAHHMASWESIQEILIRHYNRQLLHETYKLFGSAGVIGNPLGFARSMGLGIRDFLSVPAKSIVRSPTGLIMGMAQGTTSLLSNTVYAISDAASQFSKAARKGIVAFTYDDQAVSRMEKHQATVASDSKGVINEVLEGLTGLLQFPVRGAERHGLPGVLSGVALGITGLVAKPAASILEVTGKTALSIRNRSKPSQLRPQHFRVRLRRPVCREFPLKPYSWEEAVGTSVLVEADDGLKFKDEKLVACKALKEAGKFVVLTERFVLVVFSASLINLGKPEFCGIPIDLEWIIEWEIGLENIIHADSSQGVVHIVGSRPDSILRQNQHSPKVGSGGRTRAVRWNHYATTHLPFPQKNLELACDQDAANLLQILLSAIEKEKGKAWNYGRILHRAKMK